MCEGRGWLVMRNMLNEVSQCVYIINRVHCSLDCSYISLLTLLFLYYALRVHVRCKRLTNVLLHYITPHRLNGNA